MAFKMKGPSLYRKGNENMKDGRSKSAVFQMKSPIKNYKNPGDYKVFNMGNKPDDPFKQTEMDLKDWLLDEKGFSQVEADQMIETGAYGMDNKEFKAWYAKKGDVPAEPDAPMKQLKNPDTDTGETQETWEPAYEGGDHSWKDLQKMSKASLIKQFGEETAKNIESDLIEKGYKLKSGEQGPVKYKKKKKC